MNDTIFIRGLSIQTVIGTYSYERADTQEIILDLDLETDATNAGKDDDLEKTVDYAVLIHSIRGWADGRSDGLLESFAEYLCDHLLHNWRKIRSVTLAIHKPAAADVLKVDDVGIRITRDRQIRPLRLFSSEPRVIAESSTAVSQALAAKGTEQGDPSWVPLFRADESNPDGEGLIRRLDGVDERGVLDEHGNFIPLEGTRRDN